MFAADLDKSGNSWHKVRAWMGPSLGWVDRFVKSETYLTAGVYNVQPGDNVLFVNSAGVSINLPDVRAWVNDFASLPATGFERSLWVKDLGFATASNVPVSAFAGQTIDGTASASLTVNFGLMKLWPFNNLTGWWTDVSAAGGGGGGGSMFTTGVATVTAVTSSGSSIIIVPSNAARKGLVLQNSETSVAFVKFGSVASLTSFTVRIPPSSYWEMTDTCVYTGRIDAIWPFGAAGGSMIVTEM